MPEQAPQVAGAQAVHRALAIIDAISHGTRSLQAIAERIGCTRSTCHRLLRALEDAGYVRHATGGGYHLGPTLMTLGFLARDQLPMTSAARPWLQQLSDQTGDTVHLGIRDKADVLYAAKVPGSRKLEANTRVGYRMPLAWTGVGRALLLDLNEAEWREIYDDALAHLPTGLNRPDVPCWSQYRRHMQEYAAAGYTFDLEENEFCVRCVGAPVRDASGEIIAAISVVGATQYMPDHRMISLRPLVIDVALAISRDLGWVPSMARPSMLLRAAS
ncbi:MAG: IclR family transcriptional regulator [Acetobacteraceae bacterium]|nr:IclR family transcriptional regulator [Acetobacteraceae bacterium]